MKGQGTRFRHIRMNTVDNLEDPYVQDLVRQAHESAVRSLDPVEPRTIVRVMEGPKRRPRSNPSP